MTKFQTSSRQKNIKKHAKFKSTFVLKHLPQFKNVSLVTADQCMDLYTSLISTPNINVCLTLFSLSSCKNLTTANFSCRPFRLFFLKVKISTKSTPFPDSNQPILYLPDWKKAPQSSTSHTFQKSARTPVKAESNSPDQEKE